ncbi:MAG: ComEC/Rec2 family competence protein [Bacteroidales bacterium]
MGIGLQEYKDLSFLIPLLFVSGIILLSVSFFPLSAVAKYKLRHLFGIGTCCLFFLLGIWSMKQNQLSPALPETDRCIISARLKSEPVEKKNTYQAYATLLNVRDTANTPFPDSLTTVLLYLPKDSVTTLLQCGDLLIGSGSLRKIKNNGNPEEFNFARYMRHKRIFYAASLYSYTHQKAPPSVNLSQRALVARNYLLSHLKPLIYDPQAFIFLSAITLGDRQDLLPETRADFSRSGISHILAVSGLHTGIIFLLIMVLLSPLRLFGLKRMVYTAAVLLMWGYAFLTGLSPSVIRAVCMISILLAGKILNEDSNSLNTLFITAFFMLLIHPGYLFDVGFQLSFLAVLSILIYYPALRQLIPFSGIGKKITDLLAVTVSAQILVLPISLYYFHLLPIWFLPANIIIIPLLTPFMLLAFITMALSMIGLELPLLGNILTDVSLFIMNTGSLFSQLPATRFFYPDIPEIGIFFLLIFCLTAFFSTKKAGFLICTCILCLLGIGYISSNSQSTQSLLHEMILFNQYKANSIHYYRDKAHHIYSPDSGFEATAIEPVFTPFSIRNQINRPQVISRDTSLNPGLFIRKPFIEIQGVRFCFLTNNEFRYHHAAIKPHVNYALVGGDFKGDLRQIKNLTSFDTLILIPTLPKYRRTLLTAACDSSNTPIYDISRNGAFRLMLNH